MPARTEEPAREQQQPAAEAPFSTIEVRVGRLPGRIETIVLNGGRKVSDALQGANLQVPAKAEIRVNGVKATVDTELNANDTVLLLNKIAGN